MYTLESPLVCSGGGPTNPQIGRSSAKNSYLAGEAARRQRSGRQQVDANAGKVGRWLGGNPQSAMRGCQTRPPRQGGLQARQAAVSGSWAGTHQ